MPNRSDGSSIGPIPVRFWYYGVFARIYTWLWYPKFQFWFIWLFTCTMITSPLANASHTVGIKTIRWDKWRGIFQNKISASRSQRKRRASEGTRPHHRSESNLLWHPDDASLPNTPVPPRQWTRYTPIWISQIKMCSIAHLRQLEALQNDVVNILALWLTNTPWWLCRSKPDVVTMVPTSRHLWREFGTIMTTAFRWVDSSPLATGRRRPCIWLISKAFTWSKISEFWWNVFWLWYVGTGRGYLLHFNITLTYALFIYVYYIIYIYIYTFIYYLL